MSVGKLFIKTITPLRASICLTEQHRGCFFFKFQEELSRRSQLGCVSGLVPCWCSFLPGVHGTTETSREALLMGIAPCPAKLSHNYLHTLLLMLWKQLKIKANSFRLLLIFFFTVIFFNPHSNYTNTFKSKLGAETDIWLSWKQLESMKWPCKWWACKSKLHLSHLPPAPVWLSSLCPGLSPAA